MRWMRAIPSFDSWRMTLASNSRSEIPRRAASTSGSRSRSSTRRRWPVSASMFASTNAAGLLISCATPGGQKADRGQLLGLQAADLALALVGRVAHVEDGPPPRQRIGAHGEGPPAVREGPIGAGAAGDRLARRRLQLPLQPAAVEPGADGVGDLQRAVGGHQADAVLEDVERLAQDVAAGPEAARKRRRPQPLGVQHDEVVAALPELRQRLGGRPHRVSFVAPAIDPGGSVAATRAVRRRQRGARGIIDEEYAGHLMCQLSTGREKARREAPRAGKSSHPDRRGARACRRPR